MYCSLLMLVWRRRKPLKGLASLKNVGGLGKVGGSTGEATVV